MHRQERLYHADRSEDPSFLLIKILPICALGVMFGFTKGSKSVRVLIKFPKPAVVIVLTLFKTPLHHIITKHKGNGSSFSASPIVYELWFVKDMYTITGVRVHFLGYLFKGCESDT